jgi:hypothetical protein
LGDSSSLSSVLPIAENVHIDQPQVDLPCWSGSDQSDRTLLTTLRPGSVRTSGQVRRPSKIVGSWDGRVVVRRYGFNTTMVVPSLSPSGSWLSAALYVSTA